jgi:hypothetical protein
LNKLSKEGKMSGLFNLLHKPVPAKEEVSVIVPKEVPDKSAGEYEEDEDQEVDGLFFDELSPCDNSGIASNIAIANIN